MRAIVGAVSPRSPPYEGSPAPGRPGVIHLPVCGRRRPLRPPRTRPGSGRSAAARRRARCPSTDRRPRQSSSPESRASSGQPPMSPGATVLVRVSSRVPRQGHRAAIHSWMHLDWISETPHPPPAVGPQRGPRRDDSAPRPSHVGTTRSVGPLDQGDGGLALWASAVYQARPVDPGSAPRPWVDLHSAPGSTSKRSISSASKEASAAASAPWVMSRSPRQ